MAPSSDPLRRLEAEAVHIFRKAAAEFRNQVLLLQGLERDAPSGAEGVRHGKAPFPLLHIDTTWKFREMIAFRAELAARSGLETLVHVNEEGLARNVSPVASHSALHTQVIKTERLRQAIDK